MGRPSAFDDRQKAEIGRRLALGGPGNTVTELAAEFKVGKATISRLFSKRTETVQNLAATLATTERAIEVLPVSEQVSIRTLADHLKGLGNSLAKSAASGARVSERLSEMAERFTDRIARRADEEGMLMAEDLKPVAALVETANRAASQGLAMMAANKGKGDGTQSLESLVTGDAHGE